MLKRIIVMALCLLMLAAVLPTAVFAQTQKDLCTQIAEDYQKALEATEKTSLGGYCGLLASWQMYFVGINKYLITNDGNKQYDTYCDVDTTTGGYRPKAYGAEEYTLKQALNDATKNGQRDVYNIMVGFEWTSTEAGAIYGHAVFVYAIIDGIVYFTEGFDTSMGTKEGEAIQVTISQFIDYYDDWCVFDGIVVFGQKGYENSCKRYASDLFVEATAAQSIMSEPCSADDDVAESLPLRQVRQGERLLVNGLIENTLGQFYYRVDDGGEEGYISAQAVEPMRFNYEQTHVESAAAPQVLEQGKDFKLAGDVVAKQGAVQAVCVEVTDTDDRAVFSYTADSGNLLDLSSKKYNDAVDFSVLEKGYYYYSVYVDGINHYVQDGKLIADKRKVCLLHQAFKVGKSLPDYAKASDPQPETRQARNGWYYEQGNWYCYEQDVPMTGWTTYKGIRYYLQQDGSVATGAATIDGEQYIFSSTGAMYTGWRDVPNGVQYYLESGEMAKGWQTIDGKRYFFRSDGLLLKEGWFSQGGETYYLLSDGSAAVGWVRLAEGYFYFGVDGILHMPNFMKDKLVAESEFA